MINPDLLPPHTYMKSKSYKGAFKSLVKCSKRVLEYKEYTLLELIYIETAFNEITPEGIRHN